MIAWRLILEAALITGAAVGLAALVAGWDLPLGLVAAGGSFLIL